MNRQQSHTQDIFPSVVGHHEIKEHLQAALVHDTISHAYLFEGMEGIGKRTLARQFAKALLCTQPLEGHRPPVEMCLLSNHNVGQSSGRHLSQCRGESKHFRGDDSRGAGSGYERHAIPKPVQSLYCRGSPPLDSPGAKRHAQDN